MHQDFIALLRIFLRQGANEWRNSRRHQLRSLSPGMRTTLERSIIADADEINHLLSRPEFPGQDRDLVPIFAYYLKDPDLLYFLLPIWDFTDDCNPDARIQLIVVKRGTSRGFILRFEPPETFRESAEQQSTHHYAHVQLTYKAGAREWVLFKDNAWLPTSYPAIPLPGCYGPGNLLMSSFISAAGYPDRTTKWFLDSQVSMNAVTKARIRKLINVMTRSMNAPPMVL